MKKKEEEVGKGEWEAEDFHRPNKTKREERDYTDEALALLKHLKPLMKLCGVLMLALDIEFKSLKKPLPRVLNLNLLRARQLQSKCTAVSNSCSLQHNPAGIKPSKM